MRIYLTFSSAKAPIILRILAESLEIFTAAQGHSCFSANNDYFVYFCLFSANLEAVLNPEKQVQTFSSNQADL